MLKRPNFESGDLALATGAFPGSGSIATFHKKNDDLA